MLLIRRGREELVQGSFNIPTFLSSDGHEWRGRLLFAGADKSSAVHVAEVSQAQLHYANLNGSAALPARPVSIREAFFSFQEGILFPSMRWDSRTGALLCFCPLRQGRHTSTWAEGRAGECSRSAEEGRTGVCRAARTGQYPATAGKQRISKTGSLLQ